MASVRGGVLVRQIGHLFGLGTASGLTEWQLLRRYVSDRDEAAFAALVARHGPMVLGVCRRVLHDPHDVEDAFQATFLVLVRRANSLGPRDVLGRWLYGVARKVAIRARADSARRRTRLREAATALDLEAPKPFDYAHAELRGVIDEEIQRLPSSYQSAVVLCYLEGLTHEEAAQQLGWPLGTVKGRLARARDLLRGRLTRRGLATSLSTTVMTAWIQREAKARVPEPWAEAAIRLAINLSARKAATGLVSAAAAALAEGVLWTMTIQQIKTIATATGLLAAMTIGAGVYARQTESKRGDVEANAKPAAADKRDTPDSPALPSEPDLRTVALEGYATALRDFSEGTRDMDAVHLWSKRIATIPSDNPGASARDHLERMTELQRVVMNKKEHVRGSRLDILNAQYYRQDAARALAALTQTLVPAASPAPRVALSNPVTRKVDEARTLNAAVVEDAPKPPGEKNIPADEPGQDPRSQIILKKLDLAIPMAFANETALDDIIKHIKLNTISPDFPSGIPVYIDPIGLQEAEKTIQSTVQIDLDGVPLRRTLQLLLRQVSLRYWIQDGMIVISSEAGEEMLPPPIKKPSPRSLLEEKITRGEATLDERGFYLEMLEDESKIEKLKAEITKQKDVQGKLRGGFQ